MERRKNPAGFEPARCFAYQDLFIAFIILALKLTGCCSKTYFSRDIFNIVTYYSLPMQKSNCLCIWGNITSDFFMFKILSDKMEVYLLYHFALYVDSLNVLFNRSNMDINICNTLNYICADVLCILAQVVYSQF